MLVLSFPLENPIIQKVLETRRFDDMYKVFEAESLREALETLKQGSDNRIINQANLDHILASAMRFSEVLTIEMLIKEYGANPFTYCEDIRKETADLEQNAFSERERFEALREASTRLAELYSSRYADREELPQVDQYNHDEFDALDGSFKQAFGNTMWDFDHLRNVLDTSKSSEPEKYSKLFTQENLDRLVFKIIASRAFELAEYLVVEHGANPLTYQAVQINSSTEMLARREAEIANRSKFLEDAISLYQDQHHMAHPEVQSAADYEAEALGGGAQASDDS